MAVDLQGPALEVTKVCGCGGTRMGEQGDQTDHRSTVSGTDTYVLLRAECLPPLLC